MKKNSFIEGTIIATVCVVIVKIIGMLYVIPFYATVGAEGAVLYAYAYNVYTLFLDISTAGIPTAISKIINEFRTLGMEEAKVRAYRLGRKILGFIALMAFIILFVFAPQIAHLIIGNMKGGSTIEAVTIVLRCVSFAILVFPFLSVTRGLFQGHKVISVSSYSQVIEQFIRVMVIVCGSYIAIKWLKTGTIAAVGVAVLGAFFGGLAALIYVSIKVKKNKKDLALDKEFKKKDKISNKEIILRMIKYAIPVVIVSVAVAIYNNIDMILILRTMNHIGFTAADTEFIATGISTWANKISIIIASVSTGLVSSLIPNIVESNTLKKYDDINRKFNQSLQIIAFISIPMAVGISLLSGSIWTVFYGYSALGASILAYSIFSPVFSNFYSVCNFTLQGMNKFKMVYISSIGGFVLNAALDIPFMLLFNKIGLPAYWGASTATCLGFLTTLIITMIYLKKNYGFKYGAFWKNLRDMIIPLVLMIAVVVILKWLIPINYGSRMMCILYIAAISIVGALVYFFISYKIGLVDSVLGNNFMTKIKERFTRKKKEA